MKHLTLVLFLMSCGNSNKSVTNTHEVNDLNLKWESSKFPLQIQVPASYESNFNLKTAFENAVDTWNIIVKDHFIQECRDLSKSPCQNNKKCIFNDSNLSCGAKSAFELVFTGDEILESARYSCYSSINKKKKLAFDNQSDCEDNSYVWGYDNYLTPSDYLNNDDFFMLSLPDDWFPSFCSSSKTSPSSNFVASLKTRSECENNSYYWNESSMSGNTLAVTSWLYLGNNILHADIIFNVDNNSFSTNPPLGGIFDYESALVHELGHFLGFLHVSTSVDNHSVMNAAIAPNEKKRSLSQGDIDRLRDKY